MSIKYIKTLLHWDPDDNVSFSVLVKEFRIKCAKWFTRKGECHLFEDHEILIEILHQKLGNPAEIEYLPIINPLLFIRSS